MRITPLAALCLVLPAVAIGQDTPERPIGTMLIDALPAQADIVLDAPDFPGLCSSLVSAGLGDAATWRAAFDEQMRVWGAGLPGGERLAAGAGALLAAADGELLLASMDMKLPGGNAPSVRAGLVAFRTTKDAKTLRAAVDNVIGGGLRYRFEGRAHVEEIAGRRVLALPGSASTLYIGIQDGLVVASDHPLALGLLYTGLARGAAAPPANRPTGSQLKLLARHGRGDAAWEGWIWGEGEAVQWTAEKTATASLPTSNAPTSVFAIATQTMTDVPLSPVPLDDSWLRGISAYKPTDSMAVGIFAERLQGSGEKSQAAGPRTNVSGAAWRLGWLRALSSGRFESAFPGLEPAILRASYESAAKLAGESAGEFIAWKAGEEPGRLTGPIGHGPATFLALRALHDIVRGIAPQGAPPKPVGPAREAVPLPPPTEAK